MQRSDFERFGLKALSPSMLNAFRHSPAHWAVRYLLRVKEEMSPSAFRGNAVEHGLNAYHRFSAEAANAPEIAQMEAFRSFDTACGTAGIDLATEEAARERASIPGMLTQALLAYMGGPRPLAYQLRVEDWVDEVGMPVVGYIDWVFPDTVDDLKTTTRMPSSPTLAHLRQLSLYARARKQKPRLVYVTSKKFQVFDLDQGELHDAWEEMVRDAIAMRNLLSKAEGPLDVVRMLPIDPTYYAWGPAQLQAARAAQTYIALKNGGSYAPYLAAQ